MTELALDPAAVIADLDELAAQSGGRFAGAKRLAWSPDWLAARAWLRGKLEAIGLPIAEDVAGNLWATVQGQSDEFLIVGSHIDAVPDGGWLDGVLGLMTALETVRQLAALSDPLPVSVRFVDWADEEGARFTRSLLGSSACAGTLVPDDVREPARRRWRDARRRAGELRHRSRPGNRRDVVARRGHRLPRAAHRAGPGAARQRAYRVSGQRHRRRRAASDHVHGPGRACRLDADEPPARHPRGGRAGHTRDP